MADFSISEKLTGGNEGGYSNNPSDHGGETYCGISRNNWPNWSGWKIVAAKKPLRNEQILNIPELIQDVSDFYKSNFWDVNKLDQINDQQIANTVYDFGVNSGTGRAAKFLQRAIGVNDDGIIGNQTLTAVNNSDPIKTYTAFNSLRATFYNNLAHNPGQAQFLHSWLSRLTPYKA